VAGSVRPLVEKPAPETVAWLITRLLLPVLVSVTACEELWPTVTLPKLREAGEIERPGCVPVPLSEIARGELEASLVTVKVPYAAPEEVGAN